MIYRAKYGLAITNHVLETHTKPKPALASDIGCAFKKTIAASRLVGPIAAERELFVLVNAFHGWAHNRACQCEHHPLYTIGMGIEDLEGMERLFSSTNNVTPTVRHASRFHWLQAYDLHFQQWDADKYENLCKSYSSSPQLTCSHELCMSMFLSGVFVEQLSPSAQDHP